ncbi:MAG: hypothetical protein Q8R07_03150 [Candidatus Uhrbacteria bacterium]|nr:hypothetical protein [Candidatus Uhrbacteria bacterium]
MEEETQLKDLLKKAYDAHPEHWVPKSCLPAYHRLGTAVFSEMAFVKELFAKYDQEPRIYLKHRDDEHWPDTWHLPGTKHATHITHGNRLEVVQALAEREFPGIVITRACMVDGFQWKMGSDKAAGEHPWSNAFSAVTLCEVGYTLPETPDGRFFTIAEAKKLRLATHHLNFFNACCDVMMNKQPFIYRRAR